MAKYDKKGDGKESEMGGKCMRVDLSPRLEGHTVASQPPTTVLLSFTSILSPLRNGVRSHSRCGTES